MIKDSNSKIYEVEVGCIIHTVSATSEDDALQQMCDHYKINANKVRSVKERV